MTEATDKAPVPTREMPARDRLVPVAQDITPVEALAAILAEHGPIAEDQAIRLLEEAGAADDDVAFDELVDEIGSAAEQLADDRWVWLPTLLADRVFTHRVTAAESSHDVLAVTPDLDALTTLCDDEGPGRFTDGSPAQIVMAGFDDGLLDSRGIPAEAVDQNGALLLLPGTFEQLGVQSGDLVGIRLTDGELAVGAVETVTESPFGARLTAMLDDRPVLLDIAVWTLCAQDPALFTAPALPLGELLDEHRLVRHADFVAPAGFEFDRWFAERRRDRLTEEHGIDRDDARALDGLIRICDSMQALLEAASEDPPATAVAQQPDAELVEAMGELGSVLAEPELAEAFLDEMLGFGRVDPAAVGLFAETLEPKAPRSARVGCRWLRAAALARTGDIAEAERELLAAESMDTSWAPVLFDLARIASDRGDAERGLSLLRRAGADPNDPMVTLLEQHRVVPRTDIGRNDMCWCGSGRKYKKCHSGREVLPLAERMGWLYGKAVFHVLETDWREVLDEVRDERSRYAEDEDAMVQAMSDPLLLDAVLFEGGAFADFLRVRGSLLPEDERLLAEQWLLIDRSVFEIDGVRRGHSVTVRDVRTGDVCEVREQTASKVLKPGHLICARVLTAGDTAEFFGGLEPVALHERDAHIDLLDDDPDPVELVAFLTRRFAPPTLVNTEGEPMVLCQCTVEVSDPPLIASALDDAYERMDDEDPPRWHEQVITHGMPRIRATLTLDGTVLTVDTNSEARIERVLDRIRRLDPACRVTAESRQPAGDMRNVAQLAATAPAGHQSLDPDDPDVADALDALIRTYETAWLDEPIPALDGHTPRQAADDPTRRGDLIRLLDSFPSGVSARGAMDADRLRAALGLG